MPLQAQFAWRAVLAALLIACSWLAFDPSPPASADTGWDKLNHVLAFCALAFAARSSFQHAAVQRLALALLGYGVFIELVQSQIPERSAELLDLLGDAVGIAAGLLLAHIWRRSALSTAPKKFHRATPAGSLCELPSPDTAFMRRASGPAGSERQR